MLTVTSQDGTTIAFETLTALPALFLTTFSDDLDDVWEPFLTESDA